MAARLRASRTPVHSSDETRDSLDSVLRALAGSPEISVQPDTLPVGQRVGGRYEIERMVGRGGLGVVFLARDLELGRAVALKLHQRFRGPSGLARLEAEARSMAALHHPNLAEVYGVVRDHDHLFVVMEYVAGGDVRKWSRAADRTEAEILDIFIGGGRGLAAAHRAGIVHGDFKPDNLLVGADKRARVIDFGLGLRGSSQRAGGSDQLGETTSGETSWVGTRGYMAPEQSRGELEPACDQFALCVSLFETLFGARPKADASGPELVERARTVRPTMHRLDALCGVLARGLRSRGGDRWPDMDALTSALASSRRSRGRRAWPLAGTALLSLAMGGAALASGAPEAPGCADQARQALEQDRLERVPPARQRVQQHPAGSTLWPAFDEHTSAWAESWTSEVEATCAAQASALKADQLRCLEGQRLAFGAQLDMLANASREIVAEAPRIAAALRAPPDCRSPDSTAPHPRDPQLGRSVEGARARLAELDAMLRSARPADLSAASRALWAEASELDFQPLMPEVMRGTALAEIAVGESVQGLGKLEDAYYAAREHDRDPLAFKIALDLAGEIDASTAPSSAWLEHARALLGPHPRAGDLHVFDHTCAYVQMRRGNLDEADRLLENVCAASESDQGTRRRILSATLGRAEIALRTGRFDDAKARTDEAQALARAMDGEFSRAYAEVLDLRAWASTERGAFKTARQDALHALEISEALFGDAHPLTLRMLGGLAIIEGALGDSESALGRTRRILAGHQARHGPQHRLVALAHLNLGVDLQRLKRLDEAEEHQREALRQYTSGIGSPLDAALVQLNLAALYGDRREGDDAERGLLLARRALQTRTLELGEDHLDTVRARINEGYLLRLNAQTPQALETLGRALEVLERTAADHPLAVNLRLELSHSALAAGDPSAAVLHARAGIEALADRPDAPRDELDAALAEALAASSN